MLPAGNCAEALAGHYDPDKMRLVRVSTMSGALAAIEKWTADPDAELDLNYTPNTSVQREVVAALSNSFGFGGHNVTLAVRRLAE